MQARNGIMTAMEELSALKEQETEIYGELLSERKNLLSVVESNTAKTKRLRDQIQGINSSERVTNADKLRAEADAVAEEIAAMRKALRNLEIKHSSLQAKLAEQDSTLDSQAAPYKSALDTVTKRISSFLAEHSQPSPHAATEKWSSEVAEYGIRLEAAEKEREALEDGMALWHEVMDAVASFEQLLRDTLQDADPQNRDETSDMIRSHLDRVTKELEDMAARAETEGWNLLVVAIGAELHAFKEGGEVLRRNLAIHEPSRRQSDGKIDDREERTLSPERTSESIDHAPDYSPLDE